MVWQQTVYSLTHLKAYHSASHAHGQGLTSGLIQRMMLTLKTMACALPTMLPPISLYVHFPWCIQKCPYCDFNSHQTPEAKGGRRPEAAYVQQLLRNLTAHQAMVANRPLASIFIGGGTPSLIAPQHMAALLEGIDRQLGIPQNCEITLEANPGASDASHFNGYRQAGVNRLSIGIQSFNNAHLKTLGRVHDADHARQAVRHARQAGFENINIDLMFGLPQQTVHEALDDLAHSITLATPHLSWYQLTLEPNTVFHASPPPLPSDTSIHTMYLKGIEQLKGAGLAQYEVSAYAKAQHQCAHNLNYWLYGDYLGIGAGAHSKISVDQPARQIIRFSEARSPQRYLALKQFVESQSMLTHDQIQLEYMMNALRINQALDLALFETRTGLPHNCLTEGITKATEAGMMTTTDTHLHLTDKGRQFLNEVVLYF